MQDGEWWMQDGVTYVTGGGWWRIGLMDGGLEWKKLGMKSGGWWMEDGGWRMVVGEWHLGITMLTNAIFENVILDTAIFLNCYH